MIERSLLARWLFIPRMCLKPLWSKLIYFCLMKPFFSLFHGYLFWLVISSYKQVTCSCICKLWPNYISLSFPASFFFFFTFIADNIFFMSRIPFSTVTDFFRSCGCFELSEPFHESLWGIPGKVFSCGYV